MPPEAARELRGADKFKLVANTPEEEAAYDLMGARHLEKPTGVTACIIALVKSALGAGILSGHVAYMRAGWLLALVTHIFFGVLQTYCMNRLIVNANILYRRTRIPSMTYSDLGECAALLSGIPTVVSMSKFIRVMVDIAVCCDLMGACIVYQIIVAKSLKQLVENTSQTSLDALIPGYPSLRLWLIILLVPFLLITSIRHIAWLAPLAMGANLVIACAVGTTIYYGFKFNPQFEGLVLATGFSGFFRFAGIGVYSMSCAGMVVALENNMKDPSKFGIVVVGGMACIIFCTVATSLFGYVAFKDKCEAPITLNFPMELFPMLIKSTIVGMVYITLGLNYWVPFHIVFYYFRPMLDPSKIVRNEYIGRVILLIVLNFIAIVFPNIAGVLSVAGCFGIVQISFLWPNFIELLVQWKRPGLGQYNWRLWKCSIILVIGLFVFAAGTYVNTVALFE